MTLPRNFKALSFKKKLKKIGISKNETSLFAKQKLLSQNT